MSKVLPGIVVLLGAVGCGGATLGSSSHEEVGGTGHAGVDDAGVEITDDGGQDAGQKSGRDAGVDTSVTPKPACNGSTFNTWQKYPGSSSSSYPGASAGSLTLGASLVTTAGVIGEEFVVAQLDGGVGIGGDAYFWYVRSKDTWLHGAACASEIYLPAMSSLPWMLVGASGSFCNLASQGIWYPVGHGAPSYTQIPPYDASHTPTSFSVDSAANVYTTGGSGSLCTTGSGIPHGPCIQRYDGEGWTSLASTPGAQQITSGSGDSVLFALDQDHGIWSVPYPGSSLWSAVTVTSICGGGTLKADLIAANSGFVFAIDDAGGGAGNVYSFSLSGSTCWSAVDDSVPMMSISANPQLNGANALLGTDASNGLWYYCNGNTP